MSATGPTLLHSVQATRRLDGLAMAPEDQGGLGLSGIALMQRAAEGAFEIMLDEFPEHGKVSILCGKGNNAGDGYLLAAHAARRGYQVQLIAVCPPDELSPDAYSAYLTCKTAGITTTAFPTPIEHALIVEAVLGLGAKGAPRGYVADAIKAINAHPGPVFSLDIPAGLDPDTGHHELAVAAQTTLSFITRKIASQTGPGRHLFGRQRFSDLALPQRVLASEPGIPLLRWAPQSLSPPPLDAYKTQRGQVLIIGGELGMGGAVLLAAEAALRSGAGMLRVATRPEHRSALLTRLPEAMWLNLDAEEVVEAATGSDVLIVGPGLGRRPTARVILEALLPLNKVSIFDADALFWLATDAYLGKQWRDNDALKFITPHTGEAARLLDVGIADVEKDRLGAAAMLAERYNAAGVLKGPGSVIYRPPAEACSLSVCGHGNPGMASGGMGDVLAGMAGGFIAQAAAMLSAGTKGRPLFDAFEQAVLLHSATADFAVETLGMRSLLASDIIGQIPSFLRQGSK